MHKPTLLVAVLAGCGSGGGSLVRVDPEPPGANCPEGGVAVQTGRDDNKNGVIDDSEIDATSYVCGGARPLTCEDRHSISGVVTVFESADFAQLDGIGCIDGDLVIAGVDDADLPPLSLEVVTGGITVAGNPALTSLAGIATITAIGGIYAVQGNNALADISALGKLQGVSSIIISGNDSLTDLAGLESWIDITHNLTITNNASLRDLHGLENLTSTTDGIYLRGNRSLVSLAALDHLRSAGIMDISGNAALPAISLASLQKVNVTLIANSNDKLATVLLPSLTTTSGIQLHNDPLLTSASFPSLVVANLFLMQSDPVLKTVSAPHFTAATGPMELSTLPALTTIDLTALTTIGGSLALTGLTTLGSLSGFSALGGISGDLTVQSCNTLSSFAGMDQLEQIGGNLTITSNTNLPRPTAQAFAARVAVGGVTTIN